MSAYDLLSDEDRRELHKRWDAERARFAKLASTLIADPDFIDQLAVIANVALPVPQRDDVEHLRRMKAHLREHLGKMAAGGGQSEV